jgi:hypothetical protein
MKRDPNISKLIRESGVISAPANFTAKVMEKLESVPIKKSYKPLIGRGGLVLFILFVVVVVVLSILYTDPGKPMFNFSERVAKIDWQWPRLNIDLEVLRLKDISAVVVSAVVSIFILVMTDAGLRRRRLS